VKRIQCLIVGGGQAGLAMSHCLTKRGIDHVVIERGRIAERWHSERWDSLRLLTPNWQTRLPGYAYTGPAPNDFMSRSEVAQFLGRYAVLSRAPVVCNTTVRSVERTISGFAVRTTSGDWRADSLVIATGHADQPDVPSFAGALSPAIEQLTPNRYRRPSQLRDGGILIVGCAATGVQLADELTTAGHRVVLAAGHHTRVPRKYRGQDILWWLDRLGIFDERPEDIYNHEISRDQSSFQLIGRSIPTSFDLAFLQDRGVEVVGRVTRIANTEVTMSEDDVVATTVAADAKLAKLLRRIDEFADSAACHDADDRATFEPIWSRLKPARTWLDLKAEQIHTVIWATGYRRAYPWLHVPELLDSRGEIRHHRGIAAVPGAYVLGLQFLRHRNSSFIDGVGRDAEALSEHLAHCLRAGSAAVA
jgi:putative flavoprotein involved in K+ transport